MRISKAWKAVVAGVVAGVGSLSVALDDGQLSTQEGITAALALVVALAATYRVPNKTTPKEPQP